MRVKVGASRLFFDVEGTKLVPDGPTMRERPTLLVLHGGPGGDHSMFRPDLTPLSEVAQVVYLDHRSQGRSDRTAPDEWTLECWADDVVGFCEALEIQHPIVMGTSFGGFVAMAYATRHPAHPSRLILCSTAARFRMAPMLEAFERLGGAEARAAARSFWENPRPDTAAEYLRRCMPLYTRSPQSPERFQRTLWNYEVLFDFSKGQMRSFNLVPALAQVKCPVLVIVGEDDPITPPVASEEIVAALPADLVRFERFAHAGHGVVADAREKFLKLVSDFITS